MQKFVAFAAYWQYKFIVVAKAAISPTIYAVVYILFWLVTDNAHFVVFSNHGNLTS